MGMSRQLQEAILAELPLEQREAAIQVMETGDVQSSREAVSYVLEHPEVIWKMNAEKKRIPLYVFGGSVVFFTASLGYYLWTKR